MKPAQPEEMPNLDLLRSIAVLLVVVEHTLLTLHIYRIAYWNIAWLGVVGVFMFFVHTSLVLMWSMDRKPSVPGFYIRRFFRIYPLSVAVILLTVLFHIPTIQTPLGDTYFQTHGPGNVIANMLLVQNLVRPGNIIGVMWTLPLEVDMYFLLPFLYFFLKKNFSVWPLLALWAAVSVYCKATFPPDNTTFLVCVPYFLPGVMAYVLFAKVRGRLPAFLLPLLIFGLLAAFMIRPSWRNGWLLTLALGVMLPFFRQIRMKWLIRSAHEVAQYSYGIYLVHSFAIALGVVYLHAYNLAVQLTVVVASLAVMSIASHKLLEKPFMKLGARIARRFEAPRQVLIEAKS